MTMNPTPMASAPMPMAQTRMSKSALLSLICGVLVCVPFATGALAMLLGLIGFVKTGKPGVTGRWMAIVGGILGLLSVVLWTLFGAGTAAVIYAALGMNAAPNAAAHDFLRDLTVGNMAELRAHSVGIADKDLEEFHAILSAKGDFQDTTFSSQRRVNSEAEMEGTAQFSGGTKAVRVTLVEQGGIWKVEGLEVREP